MFKSFYLSNVEKIFLLEKLTLFHPLSTFIHFHLLLIFVKVAAANEYQHLSRL